MRRRGRAYAHVGAKLGKSVNAEPNCSSRMPPASAIRLAISVRSIAATLRKTSVNTRIATARPISSPTGALICSAWSTIGPRRETSRPARSPIARDLLEPLAGRALQVLRGLVVLDGQEADPLVARVAVQRRRSRAAGARSALRCRRSRRCPEANDRRRRPTWAVSPDCAGNRWVSRSTACWDSVPGVLKESTNEPPPATDAAPSATRTTATIARERFQCPAAGGGETSKGMGHALDGITLHAKLQ